MPFPKFTDLGKEAAIAGCIAAGTFEAIPGHALVPAEAFTDVAWRIVYSAAVTLRAEISATVVSAESVNDYVAFHSLNAQLPSIISAAALCLNPPSAPPEIIAGVLHRGSKMVLGGGSKSFKTWLLLDLAYRAAHGAAWFGFTTVGGPVLYLNFELPAFALEARLRELSGAIALPMPAALQLWNLRGYAADATTLLPAICAEARV